MQESCTVERPGPRFVASQSAERGIHAAHSYERWMERSPVILDLADRKKDDECPEHRFITDAYTATSDEVRFLLAERSRFVERGAQLFRR
jgi:hypothetical protein